MPRCQCPTCSKDAIEGEWEFVNGLVIDDAYEGSGVINAPEVNGSVWISNGEQAKALVEAHNATLRELVAARKGE
jgi:hypothetical protein